MAEQRFRWQALFQRAQEPLFVLNRKKAIVYVNSAWERLTGLAALEARHLICRRRQPATSTDTVLEILGHVLCPPSEVLQGQACQVRRLLPMVSGSPRCWDVEFTPLREEGRLLAVLGRILAQPVTTSSAVVPPLPERLLTLRQQARQRRESAFPHGEGPAQQRLAEQIRLVASVSSPAVLVGEPGSGKRTLAGLIHQRGRQREQALAVLDCTRLPAAVIADQLLGIGEPGRSRPGFRGQVATLYLHEPGSLPRDLQALLWQRLVAREKGEEGTLPRLLAGFDTEPQEQVGSGQLLKELFYSLAVLRLDLPPLRERLDELPLLVGQLLARLNSQGDKRVSTLKPEVWELVRGYSWPGNVRELLRVLDEARLHASGDTIAVGDLPLDFRMRQLPATPVVNPPVLALDAILEQVERRLIVLTLERCRGNKSRAADQLGLSRGRFLRRLEVLGLAEPPLLDMVEE